MPNITKYGLTINGSKIFNFNLPTNSKINSLCIYEEKPLLNFSYELYQGKYSSRPALSACVPLIFCHAKCYLSNIGIFDRQKHWILNHKLEGNEITLVISTTSADEYLLITIWYEVE